MTKAIRDNQKKGRRGRPKTTGTTPMTGVRLSVELETAIANWSARQSDNPNKAEAIRRLVELGLDSVKSPRPYRKEAASKASEMAGAVIDRIADQSAPAEERERRKRRLIKGPREFRQMRRDRSKPKGLKA
jgi:hypothetical protein